VEARNLEAYKKTGKFPEGTLIVKELTLVLNPTFPDGSRTEPSGRGFFNGPFNGIDATVKDSKRFAKTNGWGFFTFGHHAMPYAASAAEAPVSECAGCHMANVAKTDMTGCSSIPCSATNENVNAQKGGRPGEGGVATSFLPTVSSPCEDEIILKKA
jgi:Cytochrome P460